MFARRECLILYFLWSWWISESERLNRRPEFYFFSAWRKIRKTRGIFESTHNMISLRWNDIDSTFENDENTDVKITNIPLF